MVFKLTLAWNFSFYQINFQPAVTYEYFCNVFYSYLMGTVLRGCVNVCLRVAELMVCVCVCLHTYMCSDLLVWFLIPLNFVSFHL